jgi:hypothetical protein
MMFQDGEPVSQDPEDIEYAMPIVGSEPMCLKCHGTWVVGQDPHGGDEHRPGYLPNVEQIRKEQRCIVAEREAVAAVGAARRRKEQLAAIRARFAPRPCDPKPPSMLNDPEALDRISDLIHSRKNEPRPLVTDAATFAEFRHCVEEGLRVICAAMALAQDNAPGLIGHARRLMRAKTSDTLAKMNRRLETGYREDPELEADPGGALGKFADTLAAAKRSIKEAEGALYEAFHAIEGGLDDLEVCLKDEVEAEDAKDLPRPGFVDDAEDAPQANPIHDAPRGEPVD